MYIQKDLTTDNINNIDDSPLYMVNDLISTSAGELVKVVVEETEDTEWELGDNIEW